MKKIISTVLCSVLILLTLTACGSSKYSFDIATSPMFRFNDLGDSKDDIKETATLFKEVALQEDTILTYKDTVVDGMNANIIYVIDSNDKFTGGIIYYMPEDIDDAYSALLSKCNELYGMKYHYFDTECVVWKLDDRYVEAMKTDSKVIYNVCTYENYEGSN